MFMTSTKRGCFTGKFMKIRLLHATIDAFVSYELERDKTQLVAELPT